MKQYPSSVIAKYIGDRGYNNILTSAIPPEYTSYDGSVKYGVYCTKCITHETIKVGFDETNGSEDQTLEVFLLKLDEFAKKHKHEPVVVGFNALRDYALKQSKGHLDLELHNYGNGFGNVSFRAYCNNCGYQKYIAIANGSNLSDYVCEVGNIGTLHTHEEKQIKYYQKEGNLGVGETVSWSPGKVIPIPANNPSNAIQFFSTEPPKIAGPITVSQTILKEIYKLSNFNVELQSQFKGATLDYNYRAICVNCNEEIQVNYKDLGRPDYAVTITWKNITVFCTKHTHESSIAVNANKVGRRFKDL